VRAEQVGLIKRGRASREGERADRADWMARLPRHARVHPGVRGVLGLVGKPAKLEHQLSQRAGKLPVPADRGLKLCELVSLIH